LRLKTILVGSIFLLLR